MINVHVVNIMLVSDEYYMNISPRTGPSMCVGFLHRCDVPCNLKQLVEIHHICEFDAFCKVFSPVRCVSFLILIFSKLELLLHKLEVFELISF